MRDRACEALINLLHEDTTAIGRFLEGFAALIFDLPASERYHHGHRFGLLDHALEVGLGALLTARIRLEDSVWLRTTAVVAVAHDLGKILDLEVRLPSGACWDPRVESLRSFCFRYGLMTNEPTPHTWRRRRGLARHEDSSFSLLPLILPPDYPDRATVLAALEAYLNRHRRDRIPNPLPYIAHVVSQADRQSVWHSRIPGAAPGDYLKSLLEYTGFSA